MDESVKKKNSGFGFGVNDCPLWLFKQLDYEAKSQFNDQYWVVLLNWFRKAQAYDVLIGCPVLSPDGGELVEKKAEENDKRKVLTMGKGE